MISLERTEILRQAVVDVAESRDRGPRPRCRTTPVFFGTNPAIQNLAAMIQRVGSCDAPVLIQGETGSGKEVFARELHKASPRADRPLLKINCAALPSELVESELFGHRRGAFTGAAQHKSGMFELADRGAILLDEIGDMDMRVQAKLLTVLQEQEFYPLGGRQPIRVNVRVFAATHHNLEQAVAKANFRADLYYRLNVINFHLPPLRDRREDILPIAEILLIRHAAPGTSIPTISTELERALLTYDWPGNVRELENVMRRLLIVRNEELVMEELKRPRRNRPEQLEKSAESDSVGRSDESSEGDPALNTISEAGGDAAREAIIAALEAARWNRKAAASLLGTGYKGLLYQMRKLGIVDINQPLIPRNGTRAPRKPTQQYASRAAETR